LAVQAYGSAGGALYSGAAVVVVLVRYVKGTGLDAVTAADAPFLVYVDEAFVRFKYCTGWADDSAAGVGAVHTSPAGEKPSKLTISLGFYEAHLYPGFG
jgi:hypothetical protein